MFDIGFAEVLVIAVITLIVMGPERLPQALKTGALWLGRLRQQYRSVRSDLENEIGLDDVRRELHNENVLKGIEETKANFNSAFSPPSDNSSNTTNTSLDQNSDSSSDSDNSSTPGENQK